MTFSWFFLSNNQLFKGRIANLVQKYVSLRRIISIQIIIFRQFHSDPVLHGPHLVPMRVYVCIDLGYMTVIKRFRKKWYPSLRVYLLLSSKEVKYTQARQKEKKKEMICWKEGMKEGEGSQSVGSTHHWLVYCYETKKMSPSQLLYISV